MLVEELVPPQADKPTTIDIAATAHTPRILILFLSTQPTRSGLLLFHLAQLYSEIEGRASLKRRCFGARAQALG